MDASAYLRSYGWQGAGHALNSEAGRGLSHPPVIHRKQDVAGIGRAKHDGITSQWWAKAFDEVLKNVHSADEIAGAKSASQPSRSAPVPTSSDDQHSPPMKYGNLYHNFVRGEGLRGSRSLDPNANSDLKPTDRQPSVTETLGALQDVKEASSSMFTSAVSERERSVDAQTQALAEGKAPVFILHEREPHLQHCTDIAAKETGIQKCRRSGAKVTKRRRTIHKHSRRDER